MFCHSRRIIVGPMITKEETNIMILIGHKDHDGIFSYHQSIKVSRVTSCSRLLKMSKVASCSRLLKISKIASYSRLLKVSTIE